MAMMTDLAGKPVQQIALNAIGTASGFSGKPGDSETFYGFSSFNQPGAVYRFDCKTGKSTPFAQPKLSFNPADYSVEQVFYPSKDGTQIPMFIVHKKGLDLSQGRADAALRLWRVQHFIDPELFSQRGWRGFSRAGFLRWPICAAAANMESRGMTRDA